MLFQQLQQSATVPLLDLISLLGLEIRRFRLIRAAVGRFLIPQCFSPPMGSDKCIIIRKVSVNYQRTLDTHLQHIRQNVQVLHIGYQAGSC